MIRLNADNGIKGIVGRCSEACEKIRRPLGGFSSLFLRESSISHTQLTFPNKKSSILITSDSIQHDSLKLYCHFRYNNSERKETTKKKGSADFTSILFDVEFTGQGGRHMVQHLTCRSYNRLCFV